MRKLATAVVAMAATMGALTAPAAAHNQTVRPPGNGEVIPHRRGR